jgi:NADH-quinone oxidoreductase subunit N
MSAPMLWIVFPFLLSVLFLFLGEKRPRLVNRLAIGLGLLLGLFAFFQSIGGLLSLGPVSVEIRETLPFFGRAFVLKNEDRLLIGVIYLAYAMFVAAKDSVGVDQKFTALSLSVTAILIAAVAVEPFLYSAILIELAILIVIPLANRRETSDDKSLLYFLIYLSLAMPFILLAGWILGGVQANPSDAISLNKAAILLGIGFALWLGVFPFHSWVARLASVVHPLVSGFIFSVLPTIMLFIIVDFLFGLNWLRESETLFYLIRVVGIVMTVTGGVLFAVENEVKRMLGLIVLFETGAALLLLSFSDIHHLNLFYLSFLPRIAGLALLSYVMSVLHSQKLSLTILGIKGILRRYPFTSVGLVISLFSILGFPLAGSYPIKLEIILSFKTDITGLIWFLIGCSGVGIGIYRLINSISIPEDNEWRIGETISQVVIISLGTMLLLVYGVFPESVVKILGGLITQISGLY